MRSPSLAFAAGISRGRRRGPVQWAALSAFVLAFALVLSGCVTPASVSPAGTSLASKLAPVFGAAQKLGSDGFEPVVRVAPDGTIYVVALQFMWVSRDNGTTFKPVTFTDVPIYASDSALAIAPDGRAYVTFDWPYAGETAACTSAPADRGAKWTCQRIVVAGATDRMWIVAPTEKDAYLITGQTLDRPTFAVTHDAGATWTTTSQDLQSTCQGDDLAWDPVQKLVVEAACGTIRSWKPDGTRLSDQKADVFELQIDRAGTWWAEGCGNETGPKCGLAAMRSSDHGKTWTDFEIPHQKNVQLPYIAAGDRGHAALAWYEANGSSPADGANVWRVMIARTYDDGATWNVTTLDSNVHKGAMCSSAACLGEDRYAGDFLGVAFGPDASLHATWMKQTGAKGIPTTQLKASDWDDVEYARTEASP